MDPMPTPSPDTPWIVIDSPLIVFPDGSWGILISIAALIVSGATLLHTLSARPRVHAFVVRNYVALGGISHPDGDEIVIVNLGRTSAVIYDVRALDGKGGKSEGKVDAAGIRGGGWLSRRCRKASRLAESSPCGSLRV